MRIYLDYNATTPIRSEVKQAMVEAMECFGNPSSLHVWGREAEHLLAQSREQTALALGAEAEDIVFTSGATESNNMVLRGVTRGCCHPSHLITTQVEHPSVFEMCQTLEAEGWRVTYLPVNEHGQVDPVQVNDAILPETMLISVMLANNETGSLQPIHEIAETARRRGVLMHTDAAQAIGKIQVDVNELGVDFLSLSTHKFYGPKGTGILFTRQNKSLFPLLLGGGQEKGRRSGTENLIGAVATGLAMELAAKDVRQLSQGMRALTDRLWTGLRESIPEVTLNGHPKNKLPNTLNISFDGVEGEVLVIDLDSQGIAVSSGSACHSGSDLPSRVLTAMGCNREAAESSLRFSLGRETTQAEIDAVLEIMPGVVRDARELSPAFQKGH